MKKLITAFCFLLAALSCLPAAAQDLRPAFLLTGALQRDSQDLSGQWTYSKDLYRTGLTDINGWVAKSRMQRYRDIDVAAIEAKGGVDFFEFDLDRGPIVNVPGAWNAATPEMRYYDGLVWFQRKFSAQQAKGKRAFLRFEAVNYRAYVYVNGKEVGRHEGGFTPFVLEVTEALRAGENRLVVGVDSTHDAQSIPTFITDWDLYGGITRPVRFITTPETFIDDAMVQLRADGRIAGEVRLQGPQAANQAVTVNIGSLATARAVTDANGRASFELAAPKGLERWSPESPKLYDVRFRVEGENMRDEVRDRVGFRTIAVKGSQILLNGKPVWLRGISLHEEEFGPNPARNMTESASRALLHEIKHGLGGNYVRLSHYPHSETTVRLADEMGLLVWSEIPVYWTVDWTNPTVLRKALAMQAETIYRDRNRASVIMWSVGNETPVSPERTRFHAAMADNVRQLDASRLVSAALLVKHDGDALAIDDPLVDKLDVLAVNIYAGWYGNDKLDAVAKLKWKVPGDRPLILSEFGADALAGYKNDGMKKFTEEYQAEYYRQTLAMADRIPTLRGMSPWILKDFKSPRREHPVFQNGWNRKGILSELGVRKQAFGVLADYYRKK